MSDVILLRTLTEKSCLKFGKYADIPLYNLLALGHTRYLRWIYFNMSNISFMPNILEQIGITNEFIIEKPGKNAEYHVFINDMKDSKMFTKSKRMFKGKSKAAKQSKFRSLIYADKQMYSNASLARRNQGHR
jgi:hypothetical protein